ncbi:BAR domain containing protein [Metarhizium album ARSEF 1941]|uniref:BAR domain containing protein n=1 Tax=Metarhizium album (strain ARSEF 1941) TaxID=1081103 RepID=A0A0B2WMN1_METAS|nr:BAR domain containing protein [Metarhizium album ARSEF 1941]KHN97306.1 BAR domain containing protein [Metarhizium album ARSEF 1941]
MSFAKKLDRAVQWAGEKMGSEAKTTHSDEFQRLEAEMALRQQGMESLQKATTAYSKWISRRCEAAEDKNRAPPTAVLGRAMVAHGNDFDQDSEFGNHLVAVGRANERIANLHNNYAEEVNANWLHHLDRNVAMMKEYQAARKKLESRRLAYDTSVAKMQKAKRDDFRIEEEMRVSRTKFDDTSEDVMRRMQDVQDTEAESISALNSFLEAQLNYHERAAEELRRICQSLVDGGPADSQQQDELRISRTRKSSISTSWPKTRHVSSEQLSPAERLPSRLLTSSQAAQPPPPLPAPSQDPRQSFVRAATFGEQTPLASVATRTPSMARTATDRSSYTGHCEDVFRDDESTGSGDGSPGWGNRSTSSATSYGSSSRMTGGHEVKKAPPPPPPVNRAKKPPPPPVPARRAHLGY